MKKILSILVILFFMSQTCFGAIRLDDEGTSVGYINRINCVGANITATRSGITGILTVTGTGATAWDDITNPDANDTIDFGAYLIELQVGAGLFEIGDGASTNITRFSATGQQTLLGTADLTVPTAADIIFADTTTTLAETTGPTDSGAYKIGINDEFDFSTGTNIQDVIDDLDAAMALLDTDQDGDVDSFDATAFASAETDPNVNTAAEILAIIDNTALDFGTGVLTATGFVGPLTGDVTGNASGSSGSCTGLSATATALATARTIAGVSFDGTANIAIASTGLSDTALLERETDLHQFSATIIDPDGVQSTIDAVTVFPIEAEKFPNGVTFVDLGIKTAASSSYSVVFEEWTAPGTHSGDLETVATSTSLEAEDDGTIGNGTGGSAGDCDAGSILKVDLPTDDIDELVVWGTYTINQS